MATNPWAEVARMRKEAAKANKGKKKTGGSSKSGNAWTNYVGKK
jgi:hypothetical protein